MCLSIEEWLLGRTEEWHQAPHVGLLALLEHLGAYEGITDMLTLNPRSSMQAPELQWKKLKHACVV